MTDYIPIGDIPVTEDALVSFICSECGESLPTAHGKKIHESRMHGIKPDKGNTSIPSNGEPVKRRKTKPGIGKKPIISASTKLSSTSKDLTIDLIAAAIAWCAIRYVIGQGIPLSKSEQDNFIVPADNREIMFRPLTDLLEQFSPGVRMVNTLAERWDYIQCIMLWKAYRDDVIAYVESRKDTIPNGSTGQGASTDNGKTDAQPDFGAFIPNGFGTPNFT